MATAKKTAEPKVAVCVLTTHIPDQPLIIRADPSQESILSFVEEHNRRYHAGEPGGPSGIPAYLIVSAKVYASEADYEAGKPGTDIDISGVL